jgi:hypothetical protein
MKKQGNSFSVQVFSSFIWLEKNVLLRQKFSYPPVTIISCGASVLIAVS